jgi:hypothetical protein
MEIVPSNHSEEAWIKTSITVKDGLKAREVSPMSFKAPKVPETRQTSPPGQEENHEKYSAGAAAAIRCS